MDVNQEWLDSLVEGDEVAIDIGSYRSTFYKITKIVKITPKRFIKTENGYTFTKDGKERGSSSSWDITRYLQPVTQKIRDEIEHYELVKKIEKTKLEELSLEQLRDMVKIIQN